jgi:hypothetical protein
MVVHDMRHMIGRQAVSFDEDNIIIIVSHVQFSSDHIFKHYPLGDIAMRTESDDEVFIFLHLLQNFIQILISPHGIITIDSRSHLSFHLLVSDSFHFSFRHPTWICFTIGNQFFYKNLVEIFSFGLDIWTIIAYVSIIFSDWSFIYRNAEEFQQIDNLIYSSFDASFLVSVFYPQNERSPILLHEF